MCVLCAAYISTCSPVETYNFLFRSHLFISFYFCSRFECRFYSRNHFYTNEPKKKKTTNKIVNDFTPIVWYRQACARGITILLFYFSLLLSNWVVNKQQLFSFFCSKTMCHRYVYAECMIHFNFVAVHVLCFRLSQCKYMQRSVCSKKKIRIKLQ